MKEKVLNYINEGLTEEAIQYIAGYTKENGLNHYYDMIVHIYSQYERHRKTRILSTESYEDREITINRINASILEISDKIFREKAVVETLKVKELSGVYEGNTSFEGEVTQHTLYLYDNKTFKYELKSLKHPERKGDGIWDNPEYAKALMNVAYFVLGCIKGRWKPTQYGIDFIPEKIGNNPLTNFIYSSMKKMYKEEDMGGLMNPGYGKVQKSKNEFYLFINGFEWSNMKLKKIH